ncbi:hypothetical protein KI387_015751, partial [Taxus chinensis]
QTIGKPKTFQNIKSNPLKPRSSRREHCHGLASMLGSHMYGFRQGFGRPNSVENYSFHSPNYPGLRHQKDELIFPDNCSNASFSRSVTAFRDSNVSYHRPTWERGYLEEESNSSHHSNFPTLDQEYNFTEPENKRTGLSKQLDKANNDSSDVKGK